MNDNAKENISNNELQNNFNPLSDPYRRVNNDYNPSEKRISKNILKTTGEELIINSNRALTNKNSQKSIFSLRNLSNRKLKKKYNPYLISACKRAIIKEKRQLPNYKEIITSINTEFGIEENEKQTYDFEPKNRISINIESNNAK
jgi:hypothetical protein